jgi:integrase
MIGKAYSEEDKTRMLAEARKARSPHIYFALTLALNAGMRDAEIKTLSWAQIHFGLTSRWRRPKSCAACNPRLAWEKISTQRSVESGCERSE